MSAFGEIARRTARFVTDKSPTILTAVGVVGAVTTAYLAGKASFEAADMIRLKEADDTLRGVVITDRNERMKQRLELVWRLYIPPVTLGTLTVASIIAANHIGGRRAAGLATAYAISERALEQYQEKVVEKIGERKEQQIRDEIIQDRVNDTFTEGIEIFGDPTGDLCVDKFSLHYFRSTAEKIQAAVNDFNYQLLRENFASLADFYEHLNIPIAAYSEQIGWDAEEGLLEIRIGAAVTPANKPCLAVEFKRDPRPNYHRFR